MATCRAADRETRLFAVGAVLIRIFFWAYTEMVWEDALITIEHARNAVRGIGLTHHAGEGVVHGFTSAISVIIPFIGESVVPNGGLVLLRLTSLAAAAATIYLAANLLQDLDVGFGGRLLALGYLAIDPNHVMYGMAGMETQIGVAILLWSALLVVRWAEPWKVGASLGVAVLVRPDFLLWAACVILVAVFLRQGTRWVLVAMATVLAPWVAFTTAYYGSPIPHTILAKSPVYGGISVYTNNLRAFFDYHVPRGVVGATKSFAPFYENTIVRDTPIPLTISLLIAAVLLVLAAWGGWLLRHRREWWPVLLFAGGFFFYRIGFLGYEYFDWYVPPHTAILIVLAAVGLERLPHTSTIAGVVLVIFAIGLGWEARRQAELHDVFEPGRAELGAWLDENIAAHESVIGEPSGMLGYYTDVMLWDWPGLGSPTARAAVASSEDKSLWKMIDTLQADWLVLRPEELAALQKRYPDTAQNYIERKTVDRASFEFHVLERVAIEGN